MKTPGWPVYLVISLLIGAITGLTAAHDNVPAILEYMLAAVVAGAFGVTIPAGAVPADPIDPAPVVPAPQRSSTLTSRT
jgi:hypothetical protein